MFKRPSICDAKLYGKRVSYTKVKMVLHAYKLFLANKVEYIIPKNCRKMDIINERSCWSLSCWLRSWARRSTCSTFNHMVLGSNPVSTTKSKGNLTRTAKKMKLFEIAPSQNRTRVPKFYDVNDIFDLIRQFLVRPLKGFTNVYCWLLAKKIIAIYKFHGDHLVPILREYVKIP